MRARATLLAAVMLLSGCVYVDKKHQAQALVDAVNRVRAQGTAVGTVTVTLAVTKSLANAPARPPSTDSGPMPTQFDFRGRRALVVPTQSASPASESVTALAAITGATATFRATPTFFDGTTVFAQRGGSNAGRAWTQLDYRTVTRPGQSPVSGVGVIDVVNPTYLCALVGGALSGSVRRLGVESVNGAATTHYRMNIDRAKAERLLPDRDREALDNAFKSLDVKGNVYKGAEAWIDSTGLLRRFDVRLRQQRDPFTSYALGFRIDLTAYGTKLALQRPDPEATVQVASLNGLLATIGGS